MEFAQRKIVKIVWIVATIMVVAAMIAWTIGPLFR